MAQIKEQLKEIIFSPIAYFVVIFIYSEKIIHFSRGSSISEDLLTKMLFAILFGIIFGIICSLFSPLVNKIIALIIAAINSIYFIVQIIYSGVFKTYLSFFGSVGMTDQALDFTDVIFDEIKREWWILLLFIIPIVIASVIGYKKIDFSRRKITTILLSVLSGILVYVMILIFMISISHGFYSTYDIYKNNPSVDMAIKKLGVMESFYLDAKDFVFLKFGISDSDSEFVSEGDDGLEAGEGNPGEGGSGTGTSNPDGDGSENPDGDGTNNPSGDGAGTGENNPAGDTGTSNSDETGNGDDDLEPVVDTSPNVLNIDLDELIANEKNETIRSMHEYINSVEPTNKNEYTGMFEDFNLIFITAEGFSGYVIDKNITPTLYKLSTEGFVFNNFYTPLWYGSTLAGEYANLTGLMPKNGGYLSMKMAGSNKNNMMFTLGNQLTSKGYYSVGYHNNDYTYYDRDISHPLLGYNWIGIGNGLEAELGEYGDSIWPQSDLFMIENTFDDYADKEPFHTYYLTVSGHVMYNFGGNKMAERHRSVVENLEYSETTKAYIACQYELELALTELVERLEEEGIADKTLIVLSADHVPYNDKPVVDELAGETLGDTFDWYKNTLIIWSAAMDEPVKVDKYCSSLDILPTVSNLMGLDYDSKMMVGRDIMSTSPGLVIFNDRSFITDDFRYKYGGVAESFTGKPISDEDVNKQIAIVQNKFSIAERICENDYYKYIDEALKEKANE